MTIKPSPCGLLGISCILALLCGFPLSAHAVKFTGNSPVNSNWSDPRNWEGGQVPTSGSAEIIDETVDLDINVNMSSVTLGGSGNGGLVRAAGGSLTVTGTLSISKGGFGGGPNGLVVNLTPSATLLWTGGFTTVTSGVTITNNGKIEWRDGPVFFDGVLNNTEFALFEIFGDHGFGSANRSGVINNAGRIIKQTGNGVTQFSGFTPQKNSIDTAINNIGAVLVASGTIEIGSGTTKDTGHWEIGDQHFLLVSGVHLFDQGTSFEGTGTLLLKNDRTQFAGDILSSVTIELSNDFNFGGFGTGNGTTVNEATFHGKGKLVWGGDPRGSRIRGKLTLTPDFRAVAFGGGAKSAENLVIQSTLDWQGPGPLSGFVRNEGTINLKAAGLFFTDRAALENVGTINTFPGGTSRCEAEPFTNDGVVNIGGFGSAGVLHQARGGRFIQTASGALFMELGGTNPAAPEFDQLMIDPANEAQIDGSLIVALLNSYTPPKDARFTLVTRHQGKFARVFTPGGPQRMQIEYPGVFSGFRTDLVSLSDAPIPPKLWAAGRDLARNEAPDRVEEQQATNARIPQWSYGYRSAAASRNLMLFTPEQHINNGSGLHGWIAPGQATVGVNTKATPIVFNTGSGNYQPLFPDQIYMAPGSGNEFLVARWTAPEAGDYRIMARWLDLDPYGGNGVSAYLVRNGQIEFEQSFQSTATSIGRARLRARVLSLNAGDVLDFVVGSNGEHLFDATAFNAAIARVPKVTITSPADGARFTGTQDVTFEIGVSDSEPGAKVTLSVDDSQNVASGSTAPYSLTAQLTPGYHKITAVVTDRRGVTVESPEIALVVTPAAAALARPAQGNSRVAAATASGIYRKTVKGGGASWFDASTWSPAGIPTQFDYVQILPEHAITIDGAATVRDLAVNGSLASDGPASLDVYGTLYANGQIQNLEVFIQPTGKFLNLRNTAVLRFVELTNYGRLILNANQFDGEGVKLLNLGFFRTAPPIGSEGPLQVNLATFNQRGGQTTIDSGAVIALPAGARPSIEGILSLSPGYAISENGAGVIGQNGAGVIGQNGGSLIGTDGATLIGTDGATLIGTDGGSLIGTDGGSLITDNGAAGPGASASEVRAGDWMNSVATEATEQGTIILAGGSVTGIGELRGNVINQAAYISPGNSAGAIVVNGNYTQEANGTLLLEVGGTNFATSFDGFQVAGTAALGGKLVVKTINGFVPAAADAFTLLRYGSATGNFASISSNAQVSFTATGMNTKVSGPNPPAPKALNISTRMRVETGDNALIAGFIITGGAPKKVIIRGLGPSLPVSGALADPVLNLDNGTTVNDDWKSNQEQAIRDSTIPPGSDLESAIVATLAPGPHTAILTGKNGGTGVGLVEVYDLESGTPVQLANISTRGQVQTGDNVMIGGFIIGGDYPAKVLLRAIGPSLPVSGKLADPTLELVDSNGAIISNDNWRATQEAEIIATTVPPTEDKEAAIVATLVPGAYTAIVRGKDDTVGVALVEGYNLQ